MDRCLRVQSVCEPMDAVNCLYVAVMPRAPCSPPDDERRKVLIADKAHFTCCSNTHILSPSTHATSNTTSYGTESVKAIGSFVDDSQ